MIINGKRALAYIIKVDEIKPIEGYDRVEYARTNGWWVIISKNDNIHVGDKCVYFEVDSRVNDKDIRFAFLEKRHYKIKTQKMCKVISQGLLMPLTLFPELAGSEVGTDVTDILEVTYAVEEDNVRKNGKSNPNAKYEAMSRRKPKLFKRPVVRWLMRRDWGRKLMFLFFGRKKDRPRGFPTFVSKTDEERVENQPWRLKADDKTYIATEKLDGTSCTYALERKGKNKFEFYVCSRNIRQEDVDQKTYHDHNIYWDLALKYDIRGRLIDYLDAHPGCKWVCIQGEGVGSVQGNPLKLKEDDLYVFNIIDSEFGRWNSYDGQVKINSWGMKWVPILGMVTLPDTMEELKEQATGKSLVNPDVLREGIVYRSPDGKDSFKNVSREYLLKHNQ